MHLNPDTPLHTISSLDSHDSHEERKRLEELLGKLQKEIGHVSSRLETMENRLKQIDYIDIDDTSGAPPSTSTLTPAPTPSTSTHAISDRRNIRSIIHYFMKTTTFHGFAQASDDSHVYNRWHWKNMLYIMMILLCHATMWWYLVEIYHDYITYPVTTRTLVTKYKTMEFPSVTICNCDQYSYNNTEWRQQIPAKFREKVSNNSWEALVEKNFIKSCNYKDTKTQSITQCDETDFQETLRAGCRTFNFHKYTELNTANMRHTDEADNFLSMDLNLDSSSYYFRQAYVCAQMFIHPVGSWPYGDGDYVGVVLAPGSLTNVRIEKVETMRKGENPHKCRDVDQEMNKQLNYLHDMYSYSVDLCLRTCRQKTFVAAWNCCELKNYCDTKRLDVSLCNKSIKNSINKEIKTLPFYTKCMEQCLPTCTTVQYQIYLPTAAFPSYNSLFDVYMNDSKAYPRWSPDIANFIRQNDPETAFKKMRKNLVAFMLSYRQLAVTSYITSLKYNWSILLSNVGGQLGLFTGFSVLTMCELCELIMDIGATLVYLIRKRCANRRNFSPH